MIRAVTWINNTMLRDAIRRQIANTADFVLCGEASDPVELFFLVAQSDADVVLCSWNHEPATEVYQQLVADFPDTVVVGITMDDDSAIVVKQVIRWRHLTSPGIEGLLTTIRENCLDDANEVVGSTTSGEYTAEGIMQQLSRQVN